MKKKRNNVSRFFSTNKLILPRLEKFLGKKFDITIALIMYEYDQTLPDGRPFKNV